MAQKWRGQEASISITDNDSSTTLTVGILQDVEVAPSREVQQLRGAGSVKFQELAQTEVEVTISGELSAWDSNAFQLLADADGTGITDTSDVPTFKVEVTIEDTDGTTVTFTANTAYTEEVPISGGYDEFIGMDLEFIAKDIQVET